VQALASSVPVVAYPLDGTPEVVLDGITGYLCQPGNATEVAEKIIALLKDKELRQKMGKNGLQLVRKLFDWRLMADILEQEYHQGVQQQRQKQTHASKR
jgi:glycosyltransferase involved in cell wall biosynthesis